MLNRRTSIILSAKGLAALMAAMPYLTGCAPEDGPSDAGGAEGAGGVEGTGGRGTDAGGPMGMGDASGFGGEAPGGGSQAPFEGMDSASSTPVDAGTSPDASGALPPVEPGPSAPVDWDTFLTDLETLARTQFSDDWDQESYVEEVKALMRLLDLEDDQLTALYADYVNANRDFPELLTVHDGGFFEVATLQFEPGEHIPLHNHPDMTGVIFCLSGRIDIEAFDLLDETSDDGNLLLRRVEEVSLVPGAFATLTASRGNIHALTAREFTELLDVFTPPYDDARIARYRWYDRAPETYDGDAVYEAWER